MTFSVIIINYKTPQLTRNCLASLLALKTEESLEIILVDNASEDNSVELLEAEFQGRIKIISSERNLGFSGGNNLGAKEARGEFLLFLNSDTIVKEDIFKSATNIFNKDNKVALVSPILVNEDGIKQKDAFGTWPNLINLILRRKSNKVEWLSGCALFIRKNIFDELSGFDENFFLYFEDIDLCQRAFAKGYRTKLDESTKIIHLSGKSITKNKIRKNHYYASQDYYFKKHYGQTVQVLMKILRLPIKLWKMR